MLSRKAEQFRHDHNYSLDTRHEEKRTWFVIGLTFLTMIVEITAGFIYGSMALLADGWHMSTHAAALGITVFAYRYARRHEDDPRFTFGTGKVSTLGGFASAIALAVVALLVLVESGERFVSPVEIKFNQAILVAVIGLIVNLASAFILGFKSRHHHSHHHGGEHHHDYNLRAAYLHVLADALTSLFAIFALLTGKYLGWIWMDPVMGVVGGLLITRWSYILLRDTSKILMDRTVDKKKTEAIKKLIVSEPETEITDLHMWQIGQGHYGVIISLVSADPRPPAYYKKLLSGIDDLSHITIEVNPVK